MKPKPNARIPAELYNEVRDELRANNEHRVTLGLRGLSRGVAKRAFEQNGVAGLRKVLDRAKSSNEKLSAEIENNTRVYGSTSEIKYGKGQTAVLTRAEAARERGSGPVSLLPEQRDALVGVTEVQPGTYGGFQEPSPYDDIEDPALREWLEESERTSFGHDGLASLPQPDHGRGLNPHELAKVRELERQNRQPKYFSQIREWTEEEE